MRNGRNDAFPGAERAKILPGRLSQINPTGERDLGNPAATSAETVEIEIDGLAARVKSGSTVLRAARESGVDIPKLWATNCPEYKVTAVQVAPAVHRSNWQEGFEKRAKEQERLAETN